jgi:hypothetical protein
MLQEIPWAKGAAAEASLPPELAKYAGCAADLRDDELFCLGQGHEPPGLAQLKEVTMPSPKSRSSKRPLLEEL